MLIYSEQVHDALEEHRLASEEEERVMNIASGLGEEGYPWSRREEMKALAITKGWYVPCLLGRASAEPNPSLAGGRSSLVADLRPTPT